MKDDETLSRRELIVQTGSWWGQVGSVMGTSGARNPTLTLQALAWPTAEQIAKRWKSIVR